MQQKVDKHEGAETKCGTCGMDLVCLSFDYQGKKQLSWCDKGTTQKHYNYDSDKNEPSCKYATIVTQLQLLERVEKLTRQNMPNADDKKIQTYVELIFRKLSGY